MSAKTVLITGCSTGIGLDMAVHLAKSGYRVWATMRNLAKKHELQQAVDDAKTSLQIAQLDVTDDDSIRAAVQKIIDTDGKIDVLVNNAGYGVLGFSETCTVAEVHRMMDVNFYGVQRMLQHTLPHMRAAHSGLVISISSMAGVRGLPAAGMYCATKFALEALHESEAPVLQRFGVRMALVQPGPVVSKFPDTLAESEGSRAVSDGDTTYSRVQSAFGQRMKRLQSSGAQPTREVSQMVQNIIESSDPRMRYQTTPSLTESAAKKLADVDGMIMYNHFKNFTATMLGEGQQ